MKYTHHIWWLGVGLFAPSVICWGMSLSLFISKDFFHAPFDWFGITRVYLPLLAAIIGFTVPLICLRFLRGKSWRVTGLAFAGYLAIMLLWSVIDIRNQHYQMGGHLTLGHKSYWHAYFTWYFMPYQWIE